MSYTDPYQQGAPQQGAGQQPFGAPNAGPQKVTPAFLAPLYVGKASPGQKQFIVALLLSIFLGGIGAADFYLGYTKAAIAKICITFGGGILNLINTAVFAENAPMLALPLSLILSAALLANGVWILATIFLIALKKGQYATDANGVPLAA
ncbi:TM2 domain-containing protein [Schaalia suimastitidis]|uniref:TM2 domain-containing protein n=1 Tax=Schaalia suimastitidis TaxID=121163 RepID=UPI0004010D36|nr:TM2 domain-containing protein [Schaalia suimastitidis]